MSPDLVRGSGQPVRLGQELARGGEGIIFSVASDPTVLAKVYLAPSREREEKIRAMARMRTERLEKLTAWPIDTLSKRTGEPAGFLMPKIEGRQDIHNLYGPKSRRQQFLRADWRFLIRASGNIARAFAVVHEAGCVIGDINHGSILVGQDATVRLIDCDSFQVTANGRRFLCKVGVENFTPPELQGRPFDSVVRTENHDNFGLAVMLFLMLFMGRHPYDGTYVGSQTITLMDRIKQFRFAYSIRPGMTQMKAPPGVPPLPIVGQELGVMFERSFGPEGAKGQRASARDWATALQRLEGQLQQCRSNEAHWHLRDLKSCPWCSMEATTGVSLFPVIVQSAAGVTFDVESFWREAAAVAHPGAAPTIPPATVQPSAEAIRAGKSHRKNKVVAALAAAGVAAGGLYFLPLEPGWILIIIGAVVAYFLTLGILDKSSEVAKFRGKHESATTRWNSVEANWRERTGPQAFDAKLGELDQLRGAWAAVETTRLRKLDELRRDQRRLQLEKYLDTFEIDRAKITGIGAHRKQTLESYGIETAADIERHKLSKVPGFGQALQGNLLAWRQSLEARFVFDVRRGIDPKDIARVQRETQKERQRVREAMLKALADLKQSRLRILAAREYLRPQLEDAQRELALALADYTAAKK